MELHDIQRLASALGIESTDQMNVETLTRTIQFEEGLVPCFSEAWSVPCKIEECPLYEVCSSNLMARLTANH
ncbi:MAG: hypothetical protein ACK2UJ_20365 [Candidatus Promineifilaceae bacterium]